MKKSLPLKVGSTVEGPPPKIFHESTKMAIFCRLVRNFGRGPLQSMIWGYRRIRKTWLKSLANPVGLPNQISVKIHPDLKLERLSSQQKKISDANVVSLVS